MRPALSNPGAAQYLDTPKQFPARHDCLPDFTAAVPDILEGPRAGEPARWRSLRSTPDTTIPTPSAASIMAPSSDVMSCGHKVVGDARVIVMPLTMSEIRCDLRPVDGNVDNSPGAPSTHGRMPAILKKNPHLRTVNEQMSTKHATEPAMTPDAAPVTRIGVNSAQIAAAKLQMTLDRKFGRESLEIIKKIAAAK